MQRLGLADATDYLFHGKYYEETKFAANQFEDIILPAMLTEEVRPRELKEFYVNDLFDPIRMNGAVLVNEKRKAGNKFDPQFLQKAVASQDEIMYYDGVTMTRETNDNYEATFSFTDLKDTGEDSYATFFLGIKQGKAYAVDVVYNKNSLHANEGKLIQKTKDYKTSQNYVESNSNQSYIDNDLTYKIYNLKPRYQSNNKLERIKSVRHIFKFLHWFEDHPNPEYQDSIAHIKQFPFAPHKNYDDGIEDVVTYALDFLQAQYPFIVTDVSFNVGYKN
jgi:predicted phage terminase large subunit-like protein